MTVTKEDLQGSASAGGQASGTGFGLTLADLTADLVQRLGLRPGTRGALVEDIEPGSVADAADLRANDVVLEINHRAVREAAEASAALSQARNASVVFVLISRDGTQVYVSMRNPS